MAKKPNGRLQDMAYERALAATRAGRACREKTGTKGSMGECLRCGDRPGQKKPCAEPS